MKPASLEQKSKAAVNDALAKATEPTPARTYSKGAHSFRVLAEVAPAKLAELGWARRFLREFGATGVGE